MIIKTMKAGFMVETNEPLVIDEVTMPDRLGWGQVLVRVLYSGICGSQIGEIDEIKGPDKYLPHLLGHEGSGKVIETGPGVQTVTVGDHVVLHWRRGIGIEASPPSYLWKKVRLNAGWVTTFNEYAVISENRMTSIPKDFNLEYATLFGCALTTGIGVINNKARLKIGESVLILGAGGVGLNVVQGAALGSANPIIAVDLFDHKLKLAQKFGATHVINSRIKNVKDEIKKTVGTRGVDIAIDNTGNPEIISLAYELTAPRGKTILIGVPRLGDNISIFSLQLHFGKILTGTHGGEADPAVDIPRYIRLYQTGKLELKGFITDRYKLTEINDAIAKVRKGEIAGRCLIDMS